MKIHCHICLVACTKMDSIDVCIKTFDGARSSNRWDCSVVRFTPTPAPGTVKGGALSFSAFSFFIFQFPYIWQHESQSQSQQHIRWVSLESHIACCFPGKENGAPQSSNGGFRAGNGDFSSRPRLGDWWALYYLQDCWGEFICNCANGLAPRVVLYGYNLSLFGYRDFVVDSLGWPEPRRTQWSNCCRSRQRTWRACARGRTEWSSVITGPQSFTISIRPTTSASTSTAVCHDYHNYLFCLSPLSVVESFSLTRPLLEFLVNVA